MCCIPVKQRKRPAKLTAMEQNVNDTEKTPGGSASANGIDTRSIHGAPSAEDKCGGTDNSIVTSILSKMKMDMVANTWEEDGEKHLLASMFRNEVCDAMSYPVSPGKM